MEGFSLSTSAVRVLRHVWIPMPDGVRLAARIWLPVDAEQRPVPAVLEYIPYRKNDATSMRDATIHAPIAAAGYASVRVDMRGSGDSDGVMLDEYAPVEQSDAVAVIAWLADQAWCTGAVGMLGKSWGGFNGLQVAALDPPALKAIVTVCSTDDRYADDIHYTGGSLLASEMLPWAATMLAYNGRPPDPAVLGTVWREKWLRRLDETPPYADIWLRHQRRDEYWRHGSVCEDPSAIKAAVLAVGGLGDPYRGAVFRLLEQLSAPARGLLGPWSHNYPHQAQPGPAADFVGETIAWFDHWLKGVDNGAMDVPALRAWMGSSGHDTDDGGRWVAVPDWPPADSPEQTWPLPLHDDDGGALLASTESVGAAAGGWLRFGDPTQEPVDQRGDDARSYTATFPALDEPVEVLGQSEVRLRVSADAPYAQLAVRLTDVLPTGESRLVTAGLANLTHRLGHADPVPLEPGTEYDIRVPLVATAHRFGAGHRVRVAVSAAYWPWAWPSPRPVTVTLHESPDAALRLPVHPAGRATIQLPGPAAAPPHDLERDEDRYLRTVTEDHISGEVCVRVRTDSGELRDLADGLAHTGTSEDRFKLTPTDPSSALVECEREETVGRGDWQTLVRTYSKMTSDEQTFFLTNRLRAFEGEELVFERTWQATVPRDNC